MDEAEGCWIRNCRGLSTREYGQYEADDAFFLEWFAHPNDYSGLRYWVNEAYCPASKRRWSYKVVLCRECGAANALPVNFRWIGMTLMSIGVSFASIAFCGESYFSFGLGIPIEVQRLRPKPVPCAVCSATNYVSLRRATWRQNRCPQCGQRSLRVTARSVNYIM
ncbi:hypothetical protein [Blastopirellula marina]|uniref:Uncharacterized protein n=1 Tax=Blastopirellula marina TaxID=124 RepID=A0A2S8GSQ4_9BACT|nr:hypothetical protein [Blastopirellula marina]PQO47460.1 hypothetical protein C5Y93_05305 [Blastopirellula marina]